MDEEIERLFVAVRADTRAFASDIATMRAELDGPFATGLERAGSALERGLSGAIQRGKFGFEDLRRVALSALSWRRRARCGGWIARRVGRNTRRCAGRSGPGDRRTRLARASVSRRGAWAGIVRPDK
jgi:hypothetical protein